MAANKTSFDKKNQPKTRKPRGKGRKSLLIESMRKGSLIDIDEGSSDEDVEVAFFSYIASRAFCKEDPASGQALKLLCDKGWPNIKSECQTVTFTLNETGNVHDNAVDILVATSKGEISPDIANTLISSITSMLKIKEVTDLEDRIKAIEAVREQD